MRLSIRILATVPPLVAVLPLVAGCSAEPSATEPSAAEPSAAEPSATEPSATEACGAQALEEVEGRATDATLWALPFAPQPFRAGQEVKIVWRMTGSGPPRFAVVGPSGEAPDALRWGPEPHADSTWNRPGEEWGTGIRFPAPGCWRVTVRRDRGAGTVWFAVT
jgi:hypothetical protein